MRVSDRMRQENIKPLLVLEVEQLEYKIAQLKDELAEADEADMEVRAELLASEKKNESLMKLAGMYIKSYEKLVFEGGLEELEEENMRLEEELLKFRRLDIAWGEQSKEDAIKIANLKEELEHLHTRFDRDLDDALKEGE